DQAVGNLPEEERIDAGGEGGGTAAMVLEHRKAETGDEELVRAGLDAVELILNVVDGLADLFESGVSVLCGSVHVEGRGLLALHLLELSRHGVETPDDLFVLLAGDVFRIPRRRLLRGRGDGSGAEQDCGRQMQ